MSEKEFMALSAEEMYKKYAEAESLRQSNLDSMLRHSEDASEARKECEELRKQVGNLKNVVITLSRML